MSDFDLTQQGVNARVQDFAYGNEGGFRYQKETYAVNATATPDRSAIVHVEIHGPMNLY